MTKKYRILKDCTTRQTSLGGIKSKCVYVPQEERRTMFIFKTWGGWWIHHTYRGEPNGVDRVEFDTLKEARKYITKKKEAERKSKVINV